MMNVIFSCLGIILTIFFVVGTHEFAHFLVARRLGVKVLRFSIGFGKPLWRWHDKKRTEYVFALIPLGGYVKMLDEHEEPVPKKDLHLAYNRQPFYKKFLIVLAGPATNMLCAFILYWLIFMIGFITIRPMIGAINPRSIAAEAGLKGNQEIIRIDDRATPTLMSVMLRLLVHAGDQDHLKMEVQALDAKATTTHILDLSNWHMNELTPDPLSSLGISPYQPPTPFPTSLLRHIQYGPITALSHAWHEVIDLTYMNLLLFGKMLTGKISLQSLGGPITIFDSAGSALNSGVLSFIGFLAFLSIAIGTINLLPIPGLDGGHLFIQIIELVIRRPIPLQLLSTMYRIGFALLIFVLIQALVNDVLRMY